MPAEGRFGQLDIEVTSIDAELKDVDVDTLVIKLDVEGAEPRALIGARETIARANSVALFLEVNPSALAASGSDEATVLRLVVPLGLEATTISDGRVGYRPHEPALRLTLGQVWAITSTTVMIASATPPKVNNPTVRNRSGAWPPVRSACSNSRWRCAPTSKSPIARDA